MLRPLFPSSSSSAPDNKEEEEEEQEKKSFRSLLVCDPPPTMEEVLRWRDDFLCKCFVLKRAECKCTCAIDRKKEPRLMAMLEGNAAQFELTVPFDDDSIPLLCVLRCIATCGLIHTWETQKQKYIAYNARKSEFETDRRRTK